MAEGLGVAASVAGLIQLADIVVGRGYKFIKSVKDAEKTVKSLVHEVNNLSGVLHSLSNTIQLLEEDEDEDEANFDPTTQVHYIESCYQTLTQIQHHFEAALPPSPLSTRDKFRWPLKQSQTKELLNDIQRHKSTMGLAMTATEMSTLLKLLARQEKMHEEIHGLRCTLEADRADREEVVINQERLEMLKWLSQVDARKWQDSNIRLRQPGTGIWFTDGPQFRSWLSQDRSKLWVYGIAGAGKTILVSSIIQELEKRTDPDEALAFFYCDYKDDATHNPHSILGSLARQLIVHNEKCFADLRQFYHEHRTKDRSFRTATTEELCKLIAQVAAHFRNAMIVVDGLDEIGKERADVTKMLQSLNDASKSVKTLFASRPEVDIGYALEDCEKISIAAMSSDLRLYVGSEIEKRTREKKLNIRDMDLKAHIVKTLVEGAEGMFRWVACQMDYLCECTSDRDRREALKQLPPDLPSSYERILERVNRSNKQNQRLVRYALHWIVYAKEPMTTIQLLQALAIRVGDVIFDSSAMTTEDELLHWCSSLVRRNRACTGLELAHFTVKEFLIAIHPVTKPWFASYQLSDDHSLLAEACMAILKCKSFEASGNSSDLLPAYREGDEVWDVFVTTFPFITYAAANWNYHLHLSNGTVIQEAAMELFIPEDPRTFYFWTSEWLVHSAPYEDILIGEAEEPSALHWAACLGLPSVCTMLIENGMDVNRQSKFGTPINCLILSSEAMEKHPNIAITGCGDARSSVARKSILEMMIGAGASLDVEVGGGTYATHTALQLALTIEPYSRYPYALATILDSDCSLSSNDLAFVVDDLKEVEENWDRKKDLQDFIIWHSLVELSEGIARNFEAHSKSITYLEFFEFVMQMVCCGCKAEWLPAFFSIEFEYCLPGPGGKRLQHLLNGGKKKDELTLVKVVSEGIRFTSESVENANEILQESLTRAATNYQVKVVSALLEVKSDIVECQGASSTPWADKSYLRSIVFTMLCTDGDSEREEIRVMEVLEALVNNGANLSIADKDDFDAWEIAIETWDLDIFKLLWRFSEEMKYFDSTGPTATAENIQVLLEHAMCYENFPVAEFLLSELYDRALFSEAEWLNFAISQNNPTVWNFLLDHSGALKQEDIDGQLLLHLSAKSHESPEKYQSLLIRQGASISLQDSMGNPPSHILSQSHEPVSLEKLKSLSAANADLTLLNIQGPTPLALAIRCKNNSAVRHLLEAGADPETSLQGQQTALHIACVVGNTEAANALLDYSCNPNPEDSRGSKPMDIALTCGYSELAGLIQSAIDKYSHNTSRKTAQSSHDVEMSGTTSQDRHGELPLRPLEPLSFEARQIPVLKRKNSAIDEEAPTSMPGKRPRANPAENQGPVATTEDAREEKIVELID